MTSDTFNALVIDQTDGKVAGAVKSLTVADLPEGDVTVAVEYSTVNYKDGMVLNGLGKLVRTYPHVPGIDMAGVVETSNSPDFAPGDRVVLNGWRVGEVHWGGYAQKARVKGEWLIRLPDAVSTRQAMAIGTAGYTAMLSVMALEDHGLAPGNEGEVLVTGAAGGVGSVAVAILANLGYRVAASTGRADTHDYLKGLGAAVIVDRAELEAPTKGPLGPERWAGAVDNVGGTTLSHVLATLRYWGSCASVGLAASPQLTTTVLPFVMRGVNLLGIDSATCPAPRRVTAWDRLSRQLPMDKLEAMVAEVGLSDLPAIGGDILKGQVRGRTVVDVNR